MVPVTAVLVSVGTAVPLAQAIETTELGELVFDIGKPEDMREVGSRSGIRIEDDIDTAIGNFECRRWKRRLGMVYKHHRGSVVTCSPIGDA